MNKNTDYSKYKIFFESFGAVTAAQLAGVTREYMGQIARHKRWKKPSATDQRELIVKLCLTAEVQKELHNIKSKNF